MLLKLDIKKKKIKAAWVYFKGFTFLLVKISNILDTDKFEWLYFHNTLTF